MAKPEIEFDVKKDGIFQNKEVVATTENKVNFRYFANVPCWDSDQVFRSLAYAIEELGLEFARRKSLQLVS